MARIEILRASAAQAKNIRRQRGLLVAAVAGVITGGALIGSARAGTFTWDINQSGNWTSGTSWVGGVAPTGANNTDNLIFGGIQGSPYISTVDTFDPFTINGLTLNSSATTTTNTINFTNTQGISLSGVNPFITNNGTGAFVIDAPLVLNGNTTFGGTGTGMVTLNGLITGNGAVNFTSGVWQIGNINNSFTGAINIGNALVEIRPNGPAPQFIDILPASTNTLLGAGANAININGGTLKLTTVGGSATPQFVEANIRLSNRVFNFGLNGGVLQLVNTDTPTTQGGGVADGTNLAIRTTTGATAPAIIRWNGGQQGLSENDDAPPAGFLDPDWQLGDNVLRLDVGHYENDINGQPTVFVSDSGTGPLRVELSNGAMIQLDDNSVSGPIAPDPLPPVLKYVMPLTLAGPAGQNPTSGPNGTTHSGNTKNVGRVSINDGGQMVFEQGLFLEGALQFQGTNASRALDGNITVRGTASGNAGYAAFSGRSTGTDFGATATTPNNPGTGAVGHNVLWVGYGNDDTLTIEDGGIAVMDIRFRSDQDNAHGTVLNANTVLHGGGTLRFAQSLSRYSPIGTPVVDDDGNVGNHIVQGDIEGQGNSTSDAVVELYLPFDFTFNDLPDTDPNQHVRGGVMFESGSQLVVNGTGTGGLMIKGLARPNALFQGGTPDPVSNLDKVNNLLSVSRLSQLTGSGGYLTPAPTGVTYTFPAGGEWADTVPVGLKIVNSNAAGVDVSLGGNNFSHNIFVDTGATLEANGATLGPATVTAGLGLVHGHGTISGGAIINTGGAIAGGFAGAGTLTVGGNLTINGAMNAELVGLGTGRVSVQGNLNLSGTSSLNVTAGDLSSDFYTLASYTGTLGGTFSAVNGAPAGYVLDYGPGSNGRILFYKANSRLWTGSVNSSFDNTTGNWFPGLFADGNAVQFDDTATSFTVDVSGTVSPDGMKVLNATNNYTIGGAGTIAGSGGLTKMGTGQLTISGNHTYSGPVVIADGTLNIDSINDTATPQPGPLGQGNSITLGSTANKATVNFTGAGGTINRTINIVSADLMLDAGETLTISGALAGSGALATRGAGSLSLTGNSAGYTGNLLFTGGTTVTAGAAGSLGSGGVAVGEGTAASGVRLNYNAAGAYGGAGAVDVTTLSIVSVGAALGAGDRIKVNPTAVLLPNAFGGSLDRATNLNALAGAIIAETGAGQNNAILNRGTASDIFFGISGSVADSMNLGATPGATAWRGLSTTFFDDGTLSGGTITASSDFILQSISSRTLTLGGGGLTISGGPKNANVQGSVRLTGSTNSFSGITFRVNQDALLQLMSPNTLGSGGNIGSVAVLSGGTLRPMDPAAANGAVNVNSGGLLDVISNLSGTGSLTIQSGGIAQLSAANALSGTQLTPATIASGNILRLVADNISGLNNVTASGAIFELYGSGGSRSQSAGLTLNNSVLTQDNNDATFAGPITFGATGGTLASTTGRTLSYVGNIAGSSPITIGSNSTIDGNAKLGVVSLGGSLSAPFTVAAGTMRVTGTLNPAATVNLTAGTLDFGDGAVLNKDFVHNIAANNGVIRISAGHAGTNDLTGTGSFTLGNGRELVGSVNQAAAAPATPFVNTISTPITIEPTGGTLTVDREGPTVNQQGLVNFADVRLTPGSTLTMRRISENSVANITLLGNATIAGNNTNNQTRVGSVTGAGNTLTMGGTQNMQMVGPVIANIGVVATNSATVQLNSTTFGSYTSAFALNGNTYEQRGTRAANVSGGALPGLTGSGATTISANPGQGTFLGTGGALAINATAPDATVIARGIRLTGGGTAGATNVVGNLFIDTSAELEMTAANSLNFTNVTMAPHSGLVIGPNTNTAGQGLGLTSFVRFINNPPTVTNGMVAPNIIRKTSGGNEGFFLTYNTTSGFTTATPTVTVVNPAAGGATMPAATLATDIVVVDGADTDAAPNVVTVPMVSSELTFWALKTDQSITGFGTRLNIGSGGIIFSQGNNQNRTIEPDINFGSAEAFIAGREGGGDFVTGTLNNKNRDTLAGSVSGTGGFTKFAGGDLHLSGFNTFTGPVTIQRGRLVVDTGNGIGTGNPSQGGDDRNNPLTINANSSSNNGNNNHHPSVFDLGGNQQSVDGVYGNGGVQSSNFGAPFIIDKTSANGGTATFTGAITGSIQVFKRGTGTQIFAPGTYGDNTYDSGTTIEAGTLLVNNTSGSGTGSGAVFVNSGATLGGNGSIAGPLSVDPGAHLAPGAGPGKVGTLTLQQLSISGGILDYDGDSSGVDRINIGTDGFGASGTSTINVTPAGLGSGDYIIIDYSNGNPDISNFTLGPAPSGYTFSLLHDIDNTSFVLHVVSSGPPQWNLDANGSWGVAANWIGGIPNAPGATANFLGKITAPRTVTLDGDKTVGTINFDNANKYTIAQGSGGTLIINGSAINVAANRIAEISAPISITTDTNITAASGGTLILSGAMSIAAGKSATKLGPGTLTLSGAQNHGAGTRLAINSGRADLNANLGAAATGATASVHRTSLDLSVTSGDASAVAGADQNLAELTIGTPNAGLQGFDLNTPAAAGQFRSVHVYAANLTTAKAALYAAIKNATTSSGDGIYDSGMAAHGSATRLGLAQVPDAFGEANIFIRPTRVGDLNLDGNVSISDFIDLASHFGGTGTWQEGDLNYDNAVSISDFIDLASNFGSSYAGGATPMSPDDQQRAPNGEILPLGTPLSSFAQSVGVDPAVIGSAVPEPSTLGIAAIGSLGLLARRRTRSAEGRQGGNPPKGAQGSNKGGGMTRG